MLSVNNRPTSNFGAVMEKVTAGRLRPASTEAAMSTLLPASVRPMGCTARWPLDNFAVAETWFRVICGVITSARLNFTSALMDFRSSRGNLSAGSTLPGRFDLLAADVFFVAVSLLAA